MSDRCECWFSINTGPNGECENCGKVKVMPTRPDMTPPASPTTEAKHRCEGCSGFADIGVNTTNGHLWLCRLCLDDLNRKSPLLAAARQEIEGLKASLKQLATDTCADEDALEALFTPIAGPRVRNPEFTEPVLDMVKRGVEGLRQSNQNLQDVLKPDEAALDLLSDWVGIKTPKPHPTEVTDGIRKMLDDLKRERDAARAALTPFMALLEPTADLPDEWLIGFSEGVSGLTVGHVRHAAAALATPPG